MRLRVALVTDMFLPRRGGIELHVADLAARLGAAGHVVEVLTPMPGPDMPGVRRLALPLLPGAAVTIAPTLFRALDRAFADGAYDVAHCHATVFSPIAWGGLWAAQKHDLPAVLTFHSMLRTSAHWLALGRRLVGGSRWGVDVTGVSTRVATQAQRAAPEATIGVLPNGTDVAWWARTPRPRTRRVDDGTLRLACAMRLTTKKRPEPLLRIVAALRDAGVRVRLTLAGEGPERARLERVVRACDLDDVVSLPGWRSRAELRALYHASDAFVLPTRDEAFGIAALEARASGLPVIAWRDTGVADFVDDGCHGHLCTSDDDVTARLLALARDRDALAALARRSRAEPPMGYDWRTVVARHEAAYAAAGAVPTVRREPSHVLRHVSEPGRAAAARRV